MLERRKTDQSALIVKPKDFLEDGNAWYGEVERSEGT